jgi:hypothetical protein
MIDQKAFSAGMALLSDRFNRDVSEELSRGYYAILNREMDTAGFKVAVQQVFRHNRFWPSPQELIEACRGRAEELAETEWFRLMEAAQSGKRAELSISGKRALAAVGGDWALRTEQTSYLRREFLKAYLAHAGAQKPWTVQVGGEPVALEDDA